MVKTPEEKAAADAAKAEAKAKKDAEKAAADAAKAAMKASVTVTWNGGAREYSKAIHGDNFADLASQFAAQYPEATIV